MASTWPSGLNLMRSATVVRPMSAAAGAACTEATAPTRLFALTPPAAPVGARGLGKVGARVSYTFTTPLSDLDDTVERHQACAHARVRRGCTHPHARYRELGEMASAVPRRLPSSTWRSAQRRMRRSHQYTSPSAARGTPVRQCAGGGGRQAGGQGTHSRASTAFPRPKKSRHSALCRSSSGWRSSASSLRSRG